MIQAQSHQPSSSGVTSRDLEVVQTNFNRALAQLQGLPGLSIAASAPTSHSAFGNRGTIFFDTNYLYICVAKNVWRRMALVDF